MLDICHMLLPPCRALLWARARGRAAPVPSAYPACSLCPGALPPPIPHVVTPSLPAFLALHYIQCTGFRVFYFDPNFYCIIYFFGLQYDGPGRSAADDDRLDHRGPGRQLGDHSGGASQGTRLASAVNILRCFGDVLIGDYCLRARSVQLWLLWGRCLRGNRYEREETRGSV